jgi:hypothetical protein
VKIGYVDGKNATVEYHWLEGDYDLLPALIADLATVPERTMRVPISSGLSSSDLNDQPLRSAFQQPLAAIEGRLRGRIRSEK